MHKWHALDCVENKKCKIANNYLLTWYFFATNKWTSPIASRTRTDGVVIIDMTQSPCSTNSNTRIRTLFVDTSKIQCTFCTQSTLRSTLRWFSKVSRFAMTNRTRTNHLADWIWATRIWVAASWSWRGFRSWGCCWWKIKKLLL